MEILKAYGNPLVAYEGRVSIDAGEEGYFEAIQVVNGRLTVACFWPSAMPDSALSLGTGTWALDATDRDGWSLSTEGKTFCGKLSSSSSCLAYATLTPARLRAMKLPGQGDNLAYEKTRFALANLLPWTPRGALSTPIKFSADGWDIALMPVEGYEECNERLQSASGIEHTVFLELQRTDLARKSLDQAVDFVDELVPALRLWSGNKIDWLYGEGIDDSGKECWERLHKNSIIGPYSNNLSQLGWEIQLDKFVAKYFEGNQLFERQTLKELIAYFADACVSVTLFGNTSTTVSYPA